MPSNTIKYHQPYQIYLAHQIHSAQIPHQIHFADQILSARFPCQIHIADQMSRRYAGETTSYTGEPYPIMPNFPGSIPVSAIVLTAVFLGSCPHPPIVPSFPDPSPVSASAHNRLASITAASLAPVRQLSDSAHIPICKIALEFLQKLVWSTWSNFSFSSPNYNFPRPIPGAIPACLAQLKLAAYNRKAALTAASLTPVPAIKLL